jgi:hypothetical protein
MRKFLIVLLLLTGVGLVASVVTKHHAQIQHNWDDVLAEVPAP